MARARPGSSTLVVSISRLAMAELTLAVQSVCIAFAPPQVSITPTSYTGAFRSPFQTHPFKRVTPWQKAAAARSRALERETGIVGGFGDLTAGSARFATHVRGPPTLIAAVRQMTP